MSNTYFQFKQFKIEQGSCAMKVSTDACILGAWAPIPASCRHLLDIGTGTGLLSLMIAQRHPTAIDAVEIEESAAAQAMLNIRNAGFSNTINIINCDLLNWEPSRIYDCIICNPPFFINSLKGADAGRNTARHVHNLTFDKIIDFIEKYLSEEGQAIILLPYAEFQHWMGLLATRQLKVHKMLYIRPAADKPVNRVIACMGFADKHCETEDLTIYKSKAVYTPGFKALMQDYYLYL